MKPGLISKGLNLGIVIASFFVLSQILSQTQATHTEYNGNTAPSTGSVVIPGAPINCEDSGLFNGAEDCQGGPAVPFATDYQLSRMILGGSMRGDGSNDSSVQLTACLSVTGLAWTGWCGNRSWNPGSTPQQASLDVEINDPTNTNDYSYSWWHVRVNEAEWGGSITVEGRRVWQEFDANRTSASVNDQITVTWDTANSESTRLFWDGPVSILSTGISDGGLVGGSGSATFRVTGGNAIGYFTLVSTGPGHNGRTTLQHDLEVDLLPPPPADTITVTTNRADGCWQMYFGPSETNYGNFRCGQYYQYTGAGAGLYRIRPEDITGYDYSVDPNVSQTLNAGTSISFHIEYEEEGGGPTTPPVTPTGTIQVLATLNGSPVNTSLVADYTDSTGTLFDNAALTAPSTYQAYTGNYCARYESGGPAGATFTGPPAGSCQNLTGGGTISFVFPFTNSPSYGMSYNVSYTRRPLNEPTISALANPSCGQVTLNWTYTDNQVGEHFSIWRTSDPSVAPAVIDSSVNIDDRSFTDNGLPTNLSYYYVVKVHTNIGVPSEEIVESEVAGPIFVPSCLAIIDLDKTVTHVNNQPYNPAVQIKDADVLRFSMVATNYGPAPATVNYICLETTDNLINFANLSSTGGGTNGGISGPDADCATRKLNLSGNMAANSAWTITYNATVDIPGEEGRELLESTAYIWFTDTEGLHSRSDRFGPLLLFNVDDERIPEFHEVGFKRWIRQLAALF